MHRAALLKLGDCGVWDRLAPAIDVVERRLLRLPGEPLALDFATSERPMSAYRYAAEQDLPLASVAVTLPVVPAQLDALGEYLGARSDVQLDLLLFGSRSEVRRARDALATRFSAAPAVDAAVDCADRGLSLHLLSVDRA